MQTVTECASWKGHASETRRLAPDKETPEHPVFNINKGVPLFGICIDVEYFPGVLLAKKGRHRNIYCKSQMI